MKKGIVEGEYVTQQGGRDGLDDEAYAGDRVS